MRRITDLLCEVLYCHGLCHLVASCTFVSCIVTGFVSSLVLLLCSVHCTTPVVVSRTWHHSCFIIVPNTKAYVYILHFLLLKFHIFSIYCTKHKSFCLYIALHNCTKHKLSSLFNHKFLFSLFDQKFTLKKKKITTFSLWLLLLKILLILLMMQLMMHLMIFLSKPLRIFPFMLIKKNKKRREKNELISKDIVKKGIFVYGMIISVKLQRILKISSDDVLE